MQTLRQLGAGFAMVFAFLLLVLGAFSISLMESGLAPLVPATVPPTSQPTIGEIPTLPALPILQTPTAEPTTPATASPTLPPPPVSCQPPAGWQGIIVQPTDTLESLASAYRISASEIMTRNCLISTNLLAGSILYVPAVATSTAIFFQPPAATQACGPPPAWTATYIVQQGDTLFRISVLYRVTVSQLQQANCLGGNTQITPGQRLRVPNVPTSTATFTPIVIIFATDTPTPTITTSATTSPTLPPPSATTEPSITPPADSSPTATP